MEKNRVLMEYRLQWLSRLALRLVVVANFFFLIPNLLFQLTHGLVFYVGFACNILIASALIARMAIGVTCTDNGIEIEMASGIRRMVAWSDVRELKAGVAGLVRIDIAGRLRNYCLYLPVPDRARVELIAILREASKARIIGFDAG